jgi:hypothetical protein
MRRLLARCRLLVVQVRTDGKEAPMNYGLAYRIGFHPWEDAEEQPSFTDKFSALLDHEESGRQPPYGPALDVGTGSGIWGIKLAQRDWRVTGVDIVGRALRRAHERIRQAGVDMRLVQGDVTEQVNWTKEEQAMTRSRTDRLPASLVNDGWLRQP